MPVVFGKEIDGVFKRFISILQARWLDVCVCPLYVCLCVEKKKGRTPLNNFQYSTEIAVPGNKLFKQTYIIIRGHFLN